MSEASLEVNTRYRNDLEEEKARLLKDLDRLKGKVTVGSSATLWHQTVTPPGSTPGNDNKEKALNVLC